MDNIKFRARAKTIFNCGGYNKRSGVEEGQWVYGHYFEEPQDGDRLSFDFVPHIRMPYGDNSADIEVDPQTLGQFTGLKDKNGIKIHKGDIVKDKNGVIYELIWSYYSWMLNNGDVAGYLHNRESVVPRCSAVLEIIGNIYEDFHLISND